MSFSRQVDVLVAALTALITFVGCVLYFALSVRISALVSVGVLLAGVVFGRRVFDIVANMFG